MCEVIVLFNGYSTKLGNEIMKANCSCTLIKASKNIIVDTMTAWDREKIIQGVTVYLTFPNFIEVLKRKFYFSTF